MEDYKLSGSNGFENTARKEKNGPIQRYPIKSNGPVYYAIPDSAGFYRIELEPETDTLFLELYEKQCKNCRKVPQSREHTGKARCVEIKLKKRSAIVMDKRWIFS